MQCLHPLLVQHIILPPSRRFLLFLKVHVRLFHQCELSVNIHVCCWVWQCVVMVMASCSWSGGVYLMHDLNYSQYVESVVATCKQRLYLLAQLRKQGFAISAIDSVFKAIVLIFLINKRKFVVRLLCNYVWFCSLCHSVNIAIVTCNQLILTYVMTYWRSLKRWIWCTVYSRILKS